MADFHETARIRMKELSSKNPATRRAAAYYLGEAGVDEAITKLVTVYKSDPDPGVRQAAAYSLGMFRAVEQSLKRGDNERVVSLLRKVVEQGKLGKRLRLRPAALAKIELVLALLLVVLLALHLVLPDLGPLPGGITLPSISLPSSSGDSAPADVDTLALARATTTNVRNDLSTLQTQFQAILTGGSPNCTAFYNLPAAIPLDGAGALSADQRAAIETLNAAQAVVIRSHDRLDRACYENQPIEASETGGLLGPVVNAQRDVADLETRLSAPAPDAAPTAAPAVEPSVTPTPEPTAALATETPLPTVEPPTATPLTLTDPRQHLTALYGIIDNVSGPRNALGLLRQAWTDAANAGTTRACEDPTPSIPENYVLPDADAAALPELAQAAEQVNLSLALVRQGWSLFESACTSGALAQQTATGLQTASTAEDALRVADTLLQAVRNSL
jgi:hypothetical protein